jgi:hypothetical protein
MRNRLPWSSAAIAGLLVWVGPLAAARGTTPGPGPNITLQPVSLTASPGQPAAFYAAASGMPSPSVRWQVRTPSATQFAAVPQAESPAFRFQAEQSMNGNQYRAVFTNSAGQTISAIATLTVRPGPPGPFVEFIFDRTQITAADQCVSDDTNIARLDTVVVPYLASLAETATGSVVTTPTLPSSDYCGTTHDGFYASWDQLATLNASGWTFVDHSADSPSTPQAWSALTPSEMRAETCGSAQVIDAHHVTGAADMYLWPNITGQPQYVNQYALTTFVEPCFGTSRVYGLGLTSASSMATAPYRQSVLSMDGGSCNDESAACYNVTGARYRYRSPASVITAIRNLRPGQVLTIQAYLLVTGKNPPYSHSRIKWDCTSADPNLHWSNYSERYCWSDLQQILSYLATSGVGITQPGLVNAAVGRTGYGDRPVPNAPTGVQATAGDRQTTVRWVGSSSVQAGPILNYTVTSSPGGSSATTPDGATTSATVTGLTNGTVFTFTVTATSQLGTSAPSAPSNPVTPGRSPPGQ